jgi:hypothetical protein
MTRPSCDQTDDDGTPCTSWAIVGYTSCVRHWRAGELVQGPKRLHTPPYTGVYKEGSYKLDRPVQDEPAPVPAQPYPAESTETPETVETPAENERPEDAVPARLGELPELSAEELAAFRAAWVESSCQPMPWSYNVSVAGEPDATVAIEPAGPAVEYSEYVAPNPPSRRGWRRLFRRVA